MAATVNVQEGNGAGPTWSTITTGRYCTDDAYNPGTSNPIPIPGAGFNYSYWKHHLMQFTGTFTSIDNIRWYCDGTIAWDLGTAGEVRIGLQDTGDNGCPVGSYDQSTGTTGTTGDDMEHATNGHTYYRGETTPSADATTYTSGSPLEVDTSTYTSADDRCDAVVTQVKVDTDATQGAKGAETFTFLYDEI